MKKPLFFAALVIACLALLAAPALASAATFTIHPNGHNDTHNIQKAFDAAVKAGPGSTVQLGAGHFYTNNIVVHDFNGTFRGAGEHKTVIDCLRGLYPSGTYPDGRPVPGVTPLVLSGFTYWPVLLAFDGGHVSVSAMSFDITAASPAVSSGFGDAGDALGNIVLVTGNVASSSFDHVSITAGRGDDSGYNADEGLHIGGTGPENPDGSFSAFWSTRGTESVSHCFISAQDGAHLGGLIDGSTMTLTDNVIKARFFSLLISDFSDSTLTVCHNQISCSAGENVMLWQGFQAAMNNGNASLLVPRPAPHYLISDNRMLATGTAGGLWVEDDSWLYKSRNRLNATITDNTIALDNGGWDAGVDGFYAQGIRVLHNRISGTGLAAIDVGADSYFGMTPALTCGWQIIGNDVSGVIPLSQADGGPGAEIWLGEDAANCLVVGGCKPTTVLDQGTKDILINVTKLTDPTTPAATPMNSLKQFKQLKGMMRP